MNVGYLSCIIVLGVRGAYEGLDGMFQSNSASFYKYAVYTPHY